MNPCTTCEHRQLPCGGAAKCVCTISGKPIKEHATARTCPHPDGSRFKLRGLGDVVAFILHKLKLDRFIKRAITQRTGKSCGCEQRQEQLNTAFPLPGSKSPSGE